MYTRTMDRWLSTAAFALAAILAAPASADYSPPPLNDLVLGSDAIVEGAITRLDSASFTFRVRSVVAGSVSTSEIQVARFVDWMCAARWAPYAIGQEALLFLRAGTDGRWQIQSAGGEGEMPIVAGRVYVNSFYTTLSPTPGSAFARHTVHGGGYVGFTLDAADLAEAIRRARVCFAARRSADGHGRVEEVRLTCSDEARRAAEASPVTAALFRALRPR